MTATVELTEHAAYVIGEVEHLLSFDMWPPRIAAKLDYRDTEGIRDALRGWGRKDLASHFYPTQYDPLSVPDQRGKRLRPAPEYR